MKKKIIGIFVCMLVISTVISVTNTASACTGFMAKKDNKVLAGHNEDWWDPDPYINIVPPKNGNQGYIYFECKLWGSTEGKIFAGVNDQGLFFTIYATPKLNVKFKPFKPLLMEDPLFYFIQKFSTVDEVIGYLTSYNLWLTNFIGLNTNQFFFVDRTGNSVIFEGDDINYKEGEFQAVTNFLQSHPELGGSFNALERYETAISMLENMSEISVDYFKNIANATHNEKIRVPTQYSFICDLKNNIMYLYHFHNYENVVIIDMEEEFENGEQRIYLPSLFEPTVNQPANTPNPPDCPQKGRIFKKYVFKIENITDPDNNWDEIYYKFDWGDGTESNWFNKKMSDDGFVFHRWKKLGEYDIRLKAKDIYGKESNWSGPEQFTVPVSTPCKRPILDFLRTHIINLFQILLFQRNGII